jgi:hypothetical protein
MKLRNGRISRKHSKVKSNKKGFRHRATVYRKSITSNNLKVI